MKRFIFLLLLIPAFLFAQGEGRPSLIPPFEIQDDTLFGLDTLSFYGDIGKHIGAITLGLQGDALGDSVAAIPIYIRVKHSGLDWGLPQDSVNATADSVYMKIGSIDTFSINGDRSIYFPLSDYDWWVFYDQIEVTIISPATIDSVLIKPRLKGQ